jgi:hypothetical protein
VNIGLLVWDGHSCPSLLTLILILTRLASNIQVSSTIGNGTTSVLP